jgi:hypothetical protein
MYSVQLCENSTVARSAGAPNAAKNHKFLIFKKQEVAEQFKA